ncbi:MAG TPA: P-loop NTPase [Oligoflexia bacterium]|nr:P-loop NTPase [Oligoflexia bacterium]
MPYFMEELPSISAGGGRKQATSQGHTSQSNLSQVKYIVAVSSGKGGVGKSTVTVNLAMALSRMGNRVGVMDADVYGPSIAKMLNGLMDPTQEGSKIKPLERYGLKFMSMAVLTHEDSPVIWRGPMASKLIQTFLTQVDWGELDYLLIDLPPGTGDVQLTLTQMAPLTGAVVVTTPQDVAINVTMRGIRMFDEVQVPIIGIVENMSGFVCNHCGEETAIFKKGGGQATAKRLGYPYLGGIPLDPKLALSADVGSPLTEDEPGSSKVAQAFKTIAQNVNSTVEKLAQAEAKNTISATQIDSKDKRVHITWSDGVESLLDSKELRYMCACAVCVDENTGKRIIKMEDIKDDIYPMGFRPIGKYGVQISWSDGHNTGIYTYDKLRHFSKD